MRYQEKGRETQSENTARVAELTQLWLQQRPVPTVVLDQMGQLDDVLSLLVLLTRLKRLLVLPAKVGVAAFTVDVRHRM